VCAARELGCGTLPLVLMTVGRDGVACACQANLVCAFGHYTVSGFDSGQDLYTFAIVGAEGHFLFLVAFFIELQVDEEEFPADATESINLDDVKGDITNPLDN
jgi:hypothetical protein